MGIWTEIDKPNKFITCIIVLDKRDMINVMKLQEKGFKPEGYTTQATCSVIDEDDALTDSAIIFIDVLCNRATPETEPDYVETEKDTPTDPLDPTANDTDPERDDLELIEVDQPAIGDITKTGKMENKDVEI